MSPKAESSVVVPTEDAAHLAVKKKTRYHRWVSWFFLDSWAIEYLAITTAIASLAAIGATLGVYNGRPLQAWHHAIRLNTVLSTLATIMKGSMLLPVCASLSQLKWLWYTRDGRSLQAFEIFDGASRGPWGATRLLFFLRFWHIASLGCAVTLLSSASGVFVQQSVGYPLLKVVQQGITLVPYAQSFSLHDDISPSLVGQPLMAALYDGVYSTNLSHSITSVTASCPTGNCTFPSYASLAVCSRCHDVSALLTYTYDPGNGLGAIYNWTLPNGLSLVNAETAVTFINLTSTTLNDDALAVYYRSLGTIVNASIIIGNANGGGSQPPESAWDCVLSFCAKSYNSSESLGIYTEVVLDDFEDPGWTLSPDNTQLSFNLPTTQLTSVGTQNRTFAVAYYDLLKVRVAYTTSLSGVSGIDVGANPYYTSDIAQGIYYKGSDVPRTFADIEEALTNTLRGISQENIEGTVWALEAYIQVTWLWLLLPLITMLLSLVLLILTIWRSWRSGVPYWRSSALAVMEHGINTSVLRDAADEASRQSSAFLAAAVGKETPGDLEVWAKETRVKLRRQGSPNEGFRFGLTAA
jgi:hypothetical protein